MAHLSSRESRARSPPPPPRARAGECSGGHSLNGIDYHHVSSVSVGVDANLLVASRELNTVWSLAHDGSGVQWTLSASLGERDDGSSIAFERDADMFYSPHDAKQLANGNVLVVDDGASRPGCYEQETVDCFSRALMYKIDTDAKVARVVWQFSFPVGLGASRWNATALADAPYYNNCGGSVDRLPNGHYLVAFTGMSDDTGHSLGYHNASLTRTAYAWEIDADSADSQTAHAPSVVAELRIPIPHWNVGKQNGYRVVPWHSIAGEAADEPW